jgi:hypothetical protein
LFSLKQMPGGVVALIPDTEHQIPLVRVFR